MGKEKIDFIGQTKERDLAAAQREPGDYEAIVTQRPIAIHAFENLCRTDRGVSMLRRQVRQGIRAVAAGGEPDSPLLIRTGPISTYTQDTIFAMPPRNGDDSALLGEMGERVAKIIFDTADQSPDDRPAEIARRVRALS